MASNHDSSNHSLFKAAPFTPDKTFKAAGAEHSQLGYNPIMKIGATRPSPHLQSSNVLSRSNEMNPPAKDVGVTKKG